MKQDPLAPYVISLGACPVVAWHAYKLVRIIQTADYHFEVLECKMLNCLTSHVIFFFFDLWDVFEISCVIIFIPIKQCGIFSFLTHYTVHKIIDVKLDFILLIFNMFSNGSFSFTKQKQFVSSDYGIKTLFMSD